MLLCEGEGGGTGLLGGARLVSMGEGRRGEVSGSVMYTAGRLWTLAASDIGSGGGGVDMEAPREECDTALWSILSTASTDTSTARNVVSPSCC